MPFVKRNLSLCISHTSDSINEAGNHSPIDTAGKYYNPEQLSGRVGVKS